MRGKFIVVEGGEGAGKSSVLEYLRQKLESRGDVIFTREPGGTDIGEKIRNLLLDKSNRAMTVLCELFLFSAARSQHVEELIKPALGKGKNVICDRFYYSTIAYQLFRKDRQDLLEDFRIVNNLAVRDVEPDAVIYLDVEPEVGLERKSKHKDGLSTRFDEEELELHKKVREGFMTQYESDKNGKWHLIPTTEMSESEVQKRVLEIVEKSFNNNQTAVVFC